MKPVMQIHSRDNVVVALKPLSAGEAIAINDRQILLQEDLQPGHKIALTAIEAGEHIIKYGYPIGHAVSPISPGSWVHSHNMKTNLSGTISYTYEPKQETISTIDGPATFQGYRRKNGLIGIRNELWIVPTVGCVNGIAEMMINRLGEEVDLKKVDHVHVYKHSYGCSQLGDDLENTRTILTNLVKHPNAGGVLVLGLGCENNTIDSFREALGEVDDERVKFLVTQKVGDEIQAGVEMLKSLYETMIQDRREEASLAELKIGLKCGGSDGFSGITANPLLGAFSDYLISRGGTTVLTEVPEMFGAETILMGRAASEAVFDDIVHLINDFKNYFIEHKQPVYENPSPGNKDGGITTLEDKSLGCTQKGGKSPVVDVLKYGERLEKTGLNLLNSPGNDLVSATALGASGCHMVLFTTGRGTPFGSFVPTMKVSSNSAIHQLKPHWIDFNAGTLLDKHTMDELLAEFVAYVVAVASGEKLNHEKNGIREIAIFKTGVTL
ncbi:UxaA family hydrolase [Anoxynatronum buryatiense]|uniref:D-altronate dehydratase n=1 Tax=Anoxynatronum buryatiense TaxID=489973 RepID=A0AA45WT56_9CLOT|nr:altronate dehydratase family protein [Anoxynatronum buryatiense]SMP40338.1 D-altronate dehydratase [Anoxynatronum buryatiense]